MSSVATKSSISAGHDTYLPTSPANSSPNVFVNGSGVLRDGDAFITHCETVPPYSCDTPICSGGNSSVLVNDSPIMRKGDSLGCDTIATGSNNVFA